MRAGSRARRRAISQVHDLLNPPGVESKASLKLSEWKPLRVRGTADEVRVDNLREEAVHSAEEAMRVLYRGTEHRTVGETQMKRWQAS